MEIQDNQNITLEQYIANQQEKWNTVISDLSNNMRNFNTLPELQNIVYAKRQDSVDYYYTILSKVSILTKEYKKLYADRYNFYKVSSQIRYNTDTAINAQIDSDLREQKYQIDILSNHIKYMQETVKSIDGIIFAINNRIKIEELIQGVKK